MQLHTLKICALVAIALMPLMQGCASRNAVILSQQAGITASDEKIRVMPKEFGDYTVYLIRIRNENDEVVKSLFKASQGECEKMIPRTGECFYVYRGGHPVYAKLSRDSLEIKIQ
ncbi:hypothetical protein [Sandaracinobacteroides hominis]|uniref:hypothetical protein n=1 Tax=Sandaracinobacteroides hominis TaxID=2780086 RepID=UPI0018F28F23|nr:hypothetical protein [Sandaracinobacteroides hominis]